MGFALLNAGINKMEHQCQGINCTFPGRQNNPHNRVRHRTGLRRMTLNEFRNKYGQKGLTEFLTYMAEHLPLSEKSQKDIKDICNDLERLLQED